MMSELEVEPVGGIDPHGIGVVHDAVPWTSRIDGGE